MCGGSEKIKVWGKGSGTPVPHPFSWDEAWSKTLGILFYMFARNMHFISEVAF